jgi:uncharacterized protein YqcC (DUF446 family)
MRGDSGVFIGNEDMTTPDFCALVAEKLNEIEAEMHAVGLWQASPLRPDQLESPGAFGVDKMTFSQWLQFIFIPRVREAVASKQFPPSSEVGTQAVREFDAEPGAAHLVRLLSEFDALFRDRS